MKRRRNSQFYGSNLSFIDMLFNIIILFVLLFFASLLLMNPPEKSRGLETKADLLVVMTWPDNSGHDIDLWIKTPDDTLIGYPNKENTYLHLERDNLGTGNNFVQQGEVRIDLPERREVMTFRGKKDGRYVVNTFFYGKGYIEPNNAVPVPVVVELIQVNPTYQVLARKEISLELVKDEKTAFAFIIENNAVANIENDIEEPFVLNRSATQTSPSSPHESGR